MEPFSLGRRAGAPGDRRQARRAPLRWPVVAPPHQHGGRRAGPRGVPAVPPVVPGPGERRQQAGPVPRSRRASSARAGDLWDPTVGAGTVPHQHLGYLFPAGPLVLGSSTRSARPTGWPSASGGARSRSSPRSGPAGSSGCSASDGLAALAGALVYACTPYQLAFTARISVLLLPWAALPWLVGLTHARDPRSGAGDGPAAARARACFAGRWDQRVVAAAGRRSARCCGWSARRRAARTGRAGAGRGRADRPRSRRACRSGGSSGVRLQGAYGLPVLQLTENLRDGRRGVRPRATCCAGWATGSSTGATTRATPSTRPRTTTSNALVVASPTRCRWLALAAVVVAPVGPPQPTSRCSSWSGTVVAVGSWPFDDPSPYGRAVADLHHGHVDRAGASELAPGRCRSSCSASPALLAAAVAGIPRRTWRRVACVGPSRVLALGDPPARVAGRLPLRRTWRGPRRSPSTGRRPSRPSTRAITAPGSSRCPGRPSRPTAGAPRSIRSRPALIDRPVPRAGGAARRHAAVGEPARPPSTVGCSSGPSSRRRSRRSPGSSGSGRCPCAPTSSSRARFDAPAVEDRVGGAHRIRRRRARRSRSGSARREATGDDPALPSVALFDVDGPVPIVRTAPPRATGGAGRRRRRHRRRGGGRAARRSVARALRHRPRRRARSTRRWTAGRRPRPHRLEPAADRDVVLLASRTRAGPPSGRARPQPDPTGYDFRLDPFPGVDDDDRTVVEQVGGDGRGDERRRSRATGGARRPRGRR